MGRVKQGGPGSIVTLGHAFRKTGLYRARYSAYMQSDKWRGLTRAVRERDGNKCRACGLLTSAEDKLAVHHSRYWSPFKVDDPANLVTLCREHHDQCHEGTPRTGAGLARQTRRVLALARHEQPDQADADGLADHWGDRQGPDRSTLIGGAVAVGVTFVSAFFFTDSSANALHALPCPPIIGGPTCKQSETVSAAPRLEVSSSAPSGSSAPVQRSPSSSLPSSRSLPASSVPPSLSPLPSSSGSPSTSGSTSSPQFDASDPSTWTAEELAVWTRCTTGGQDMAQTDHAHRSRAECLRDLRAFHSRSTVRA